AGSSGHRGPSSSSPMTAARRRLGPWSTSSSWIPSSRKPRSLGTIAPLAEPSATTIDSDREAAAAAAAAGGVGVAEFEAGPLQALDVVDLGAHQVHEAHLIADQ